MMEKNVEHEKMNAISEVIGGTELISNSTDKKRIRIIKRLKKVIADLRATRLRLRKKTR